MQITCKNPNKMTANVAHVVLASATFFVLNSDDEEDDRQQRRQRTRSWGWRFNSAFTMWIVEEENKKFILSTRNAILGKTPCSVGILLLVNFSASLAVALMRIHIFDSHPRGQLSVSTYIDVRCRRTWTRCYFCVSDAASTYVNVPCLNRPSVLSLCVGLEWWSLEFKRAKLKCTILYYITKYYIRNLSYSQNQTLKYTILFNTMLYYVVPGTATMRRHCHLLVYQTAPLMQQRQTDNFTSRRRR